MTTAPAAPQEQILYGPDGQALTSGTSTRAAAIERPAGPAGEWRATHTTGNATVWEKTTTPAPASAPAAVPARKTETDDHQEQLAARDKRISALEARVADLTAQPVPAPAPTKQAKPRKGFNHWGPWIALWAAVGLTASGEYALAHFVGFHPAVSALLPIGIDIYVIQAFRRHRDVAAALILMVLTNALVHLAEAGLFGVETVTGRNGETAYEPTWWLIVLVSAIAPFIVWRVHRITETTPATALSTTSETARETAPAAVAATPAATPDVVSPAPRNAVAPAPATPAADPATPTVAAAETAPHQRETAPATRRATPRRNTATRNRKPAETGVAAPSKLRSKEEQLSIVAPFVDDWDGPEKDLPLQPIADALGASKATASRRVAEYRAKKSA